MQKIAVPYLYFKAIFWLVVLACSPLSALAQLKAGFTQDKTQGCLPLIINFSDASLGNINSYYWEFGNGNTSTLKNPGTVYTTPGSFTVKLIVTDNAGKKDSVIKSLLVTAFANPVAGFTANPSSGCENLKVQFTNTSIVTSNPIVSWAWNFGDGTDAQQQSPEHIYTTAGTYAVSLIVTDSKGCKNILNQPGTVQISAPPAVAFSAAEKGGCKLPQAINFKNNTPSQSGKTFTYLWDFGDGNTSTAENPTHTYTLQGNFNVSLTVTDNSNCSKTVSTANFISIGKTIAAFDADTTSGCSPLEVKFTDKSTAVPGNARLVWRFGNGDSAVGAAPAYTYTQAGLYTVTLEITSPEGCGDKTVKTGFINVTPAPPLDFTSNDTLNCYDKNTFKFFGIGTGVQKWEWDFGENRPKMSQQNPVKQYDTTGVFTVTLKATFAGGCVVTKTKKDYIKNKPLQAAFFTEDIAGCAPYRVTFKDRSTAYYGIKNHSWVFGDGQISSLANPVHTYNQWGNYTPRLVITDSAGCTDTVRFSYIQVGPKANPDFFADPLQGCKQDMKKVKFTNTTDISTIKVDSFLWDLVVSQPKMGDTSAVYGNYGNDYDFKTSPDSVTIMLVAKANGCYDTIIKKNYIVLFPPDVRVNFPIDNCKLDTITFTNNSLGADFFKWELNGQPVSNTVQFKRFLFPGQHTLKGYARNDSNGCLDTQEYKFKILPPLVANINMYKKSGCNNDSITFFASGLILERAPYQFLWKLNGLPVSDKSAFAAIFTDTGKYDVSLSVTDAFGCFRDTTLVNAVNLTPPDVEAVVWPAKGCLPMPAQLVVKGSQTGLKYARWIIGDTTLTATNDTLPFTFDKIIAGMNTAGLDVQLEVEDSAGCTFRKKTKVHLSNITAQFATSFALGCNTTALSFFNSSTLLMPVGGIKFNWLLNDTGRFAQASNKQDFIDDGNHKLRLIITDTLLGCSDTVEKTVPIKVKKMKAGFSVDKTAISCPPLISTFTDASIVANTNIYEVQWWFGDSSSSIIKSPVKNYFYPGNYAITYAISDGAGCSDTITVPGKVFVGGPQGTISLDRDSGCSPLEVNFSATAGPYESVRWDFGDGVILPGKNLKNIYTRPGTYQPHMVLEDTAGCIIFYPTKRPVRVYASPVPDFTASGLCRYDDFIFTNQTTDGQTFIWRFGSDSSTALHAKHNFGATGNHVVALEATSTAGCKAVKTKTVVIPELKAAFKPKNSSSCRDEQVMLVDESTAGAGIAAWEWWAGDGRKDTGKVPLFVYSTPGTYSLSLIIKDNNGCYDSAIDAQTLTVFDTLVPAPPFAYRVTVEEDYSLRFEFTGYKQPDFGKYIIYRGRAKEPMQMYKEITVSADTVYIDKNVSPDDFSYSYYVLNSSYCGRLSSNSRTHTSILLKATPDTNAVRLNWSAYMGWDVVKEYRIFRKEPGGAFIQLATVAGTDTAYTDTSAWCNLQYTYHVMAVENAVVPQVSRSNNAQESPIHKTTVLPGTIIRATVEEDKNIRIEYAPPAVQKMPVVLFTLEKSMDGINYQTVYTSPACCVPYIDEDVDVHNRSYYYRLRSTDYCGDVSPPGNLGKSILLRCDINGDENVEVNWTTYRHWDDGVKHYELEAMDANGNFTKAATNNYTDTVYVDETGNYNYMAQICYRVMAISNTGVVSYSNIDCTKGKSSLFVPNAFTPNKDGLNTTFVIVGSYIKTYELRIFNRYGELLYTSASLENCWDGSFKGVPVQDGAYLYVITALGMDGKKHNRSGTVTVLR